ncbi:MAG: hypothetical protein P4L74_02285 [Candidatus Doudnabacteria bacterium]|nr:hypothetical protein [Candidatus Doudnabacteria bacterium]
MSKKHKRFANQGFAPAAAVSHPRAVLSHESEYKIIKHDLIKVVALNLVYLAVILFLYFGNQRTHFVDNWFAKLLHF